MRVKHRVQLPPTTEAPGTARREVAAVLGDGHPLREHALLLVSELVTNVVLHVGSELELVVKDGDGSLRVEVVDRSPELPTRALTADEHGGFGLAIVDAVADRWGIEPEDHGKRVWFELDRPFGNR